MANKLPLCHASELYFTVRGRNLETHGENQRLMLNQKDGQSKGLKAFLTRNIVFY